MCHRAWDILGFQWSLINLVVDCARVNTHLHVGDTHSNKFKVQSRRLLYNAPNPTDPLLHHIKIVLTKFYIKITRYTIYMTHKK